MLVFTLRGYLQTWGKAEGQLLSHSSYTAKYKAHCGYVITSDHRLCNRSFQSFFPVCHRSITITRDTSFCQLWIHLPLCCPRYHKLPLYWESELLVIWSYLRMTKMSKMQKHLLWLNTTHLSFSVINVFCGIILQMLTFVTVCIHSKVSYDKNWWQILQSYMAT